MKKFIMSLVTLVVFVLLAACSSNQNDSSSDKMSNEQSSSSSSADMAMPQQAKQEKVTENSSAIVPPNDAEYDQMYFEDYGTNPFVATEDDRLSTFAIDVDTGSYTVARNYVQRSSLPPKSAVRAEEFINYFKPDIDAPEDDTFAVQVDGGDSIFGEGYKLMRIAVKGKEIKADERKPANLIFVIDVSGSMDRENRLELVKKSLRLLTEQLDGRDQIGIVVYGSNGRVVLEPTSIDEKENILRAIDEFQSEGSTNAEEGLTLGYKMAREYYTEGAINRVILCSDGVANVGKTGSDSILEQIKEYAQKDITLSSFGFGMGNYNDVLMEQLADRGDGNYAYIDSFSEARRVFMEEATGTLQTIAKDVKIQVDFDPEKVDRYRLIGYENRDVRDEDFRNDKVDGGEIGSGHIVTALYEVKVKGDTLQNLGEFRLRYKAPEDNEFSEISQPLAVGTALSKELQFTAAVAEYAEILRGSYWAKESSLKDVLTVAEKSAEGLKQLEFVELVKDTLAIRQ
jgi:Ca-activated chloride channel family protein